VKLVNLADVFSFLNGLNLSPQGKSVNVFKDEDKAEEEMKKTDLWSRQLNHSNYVLVGLINRIRIVAFGQSKIWHIQLETLPVRLHIFLRLS
jgi:hypothetical protein